MKYVHTTIHPNGKETYLHGQFETAAEFRSPEFDSEFIEYQRTYLHADASGKLRYIDTDPAAAVTFIIWVSEDQTARYSAKLKEFWHGHLVTVTAEKLRNNRKAADLRRKLTEARKAVEALEEELSAC